MQRHFKLESKNLKAQLLTTGSQAELAAELAEPSTQALKQRRPEDLKKVHDLEGKIYCEYIEVNKNYLQLLAGHNTGGGLRHGRYGRQGAGTE
jgi:hypothetical protein